MFKFKQVCIIKVEKLNSLFKLFLQWTGTPPSHPDVMSWKDLVALGEDQSEDLLVERQKQMAINQCATLVYTSGTTGMPKGII